MNLEETALGLPRREKMRLMEVLWNDLGSQPDDINSPSWHQKALAETESRLADGSEAIYDWPEAKKMLNSRK